MSAAGDTPFEPFRLVYRRQLVAGTVGFVPFVVAAVAMALLGLDGDRPATGGYWGGFVGALIGTVFGLRRMVRKRLVGARPLPAGARLTSERRRPTAAELRRIALPTAVVMLALLAFLRALDCSVLGVVAWVSALSAFVLGVTLAVLRRELARAPGEPFQRVDQPVRFTTGLERTPFALGPPRD